jgi:hypothetical protein
MWERERETLVCACGCVCSQWVLGEANSIMKKLIMTKINMNEIIMVKI